MGYEPLVGDDAAEWRSLLERFVDESETDQKLVELLYIAKTQPKDSNERKQAINEIFGLIKPKLRFSALYDDIDSLVRFHRAIHNFDPEKGEKIRGKKVTSPQPKLNLKDSLARWLNKNLSWRKLDAMLKEQEQENNEQSADAPISTRDDSTESSLLEMISYEPNETSFWTLQGDMPVAPVQIVWDYLLNHYQTQLAQKSYYGHSYREIIDLMMQGLNATQIAEILETGYDGFNDHYNKHFEPFIASLIIFAALQSDDLDLEELIEVIKRDEKRILKGCHIRGYPQCNAQYLALSGDLRKQPPLDFELVAQELQQRGMSSKTAIPKRIAEFWEKKAFPAVGKLVVEEKTLFWKLFRN